MSSTEIALIQPAGVMPCPPVPPHVEQLLEAWLTGRSAQTIKAYRGDLRHFANWTRSPSPGVAVAELLRLAPAQANGTALLYRNDQVDRGEAPATIARHLAALRSLVTLARTLGLVTWALEIHAPRPEPRRDTRGPDRDERRRLWKALASLGDGPRARRDRAAIALCFDLALRRMEVLGLDLAHVDLAGKTISIRGKGRKERQSLTLPPATVRTIGEWIEARGLEPGPLFVRLDRGVAGGNLGRLTGEGLARAVAAVGRKAKLPRPLHPHMLRHSAITAALDAGNDVRKVRLFSRHGRIETVIRYDDAREDAGARIARDVSRERK